MSSTGECLHNALAACAAGISVWPPEQDGTKRPMGSWKRAQSARADESTIRGWYAPGRTGVGWVTGAISGNLEVLDFDDRSIWVEYQRLCRNAGLGDLLDRVISGYLEYTPNGAHLIYRCEEISGSQKLASRPQADGKPKTLIETKGEGGFIIVAPSFGGIHPGGASYTIESGGIESIVTLTPEERRSLHEVACIFDDIPKTDEQARPVDATVIGGRPGDDYCARATWAEVLEPHGWVPVSARLGVTSWRRPGKDRGISATTNHADSDLLYVFSTSTTFEPERGYNKFSAYAVLNHWGDFKEAASQLRLKGYGLEVPDYSDVDTSGIMSQPRKHAKMEPPPVKDLLKVPGLVGDVAAWINESSNKEQPVLALAASIAAVSALVGRKVQSRTGLRSNLYVLGVGETGCGKERARQAIGRLFNRLQLDKMLGDSFASDAAVESALAQSPTRLFLIDELGYFLGTVRDELAPSHLKSIVPVLLRMYSSAEGVYRRRTYVTQEGTDPSIEQPCLSIYGTTVPSNFYQNITKAHITNGLLSRLLVFESSDPDPEMRLDIPTAKKEPPQQLVDECRVWADAPINDDDDAGNLEARTVPAPREINETEPARRAYEKLEERMRDRRKAEREAGRDQGPFTRVTATAMKLGLIRACGVNPDSPEVTEEDAQWGSDLAWRLTEDFMARVGDAAPENKTESDAQRVLKVVRDAKEITRQKLIRRTRFLSSRQLNDVLATLIEAGDIALETENTKGRSRTKYFLPGKKDLSSQAPSGEILS